MTDSIPFNQRAWQDDLEQPDWSDYTDELDDEDDHDRRYDAMYSDRTEVADNDMVE